MHSKVCKKILPGCDTFVIIPGLCWDTVSLGLKKIKTTP